MHSPPDVATLAIASLATALVLIIFTIPLTTLTSTARTLGAGPGAQAWILSAMSVGAAAALLGSGVIGDDFGRRRTFVAGAVVLALASALGALAPNALLLIMARIVQGLGGGAILACGLGLIGQAYPGVVLARATGIWAAALGAGVAVGPIVSAALDSLAGWRLVYWFFAATIAALASGAGVLSIMSLIPFILQRAMGLDIVLGSIVLLAWSATSAITAIATRWIPAAPRNLMIGGLVACAAGQLAVYGL